jgi:hypothetical protein
VSSLRGVSIGLLLLTGLPVLDQRASSGESEQPAGFRDSRSREQPQPTGSSSVGVQEVPRPDGGRDLIYYSVTPPEEKQYRRKAEEQKYEKSMEALKSLIIIKP